MALFIGLATFISGGYTGDTMRWDLYEDSNNVLVDSHSEPGPHGQVYEFAFSNNIRDIPYRIELYDVPPGATVGNIVKSWVVTPTTSTIQLEDDIEIIVGHGDVYDPVQDDTTTPPIPPAAGKIYNVYKRVDGQLLRVREPEFTANVDGSFTLTNGITFSDDDVYILRIKPVLIINPPGSVQAGFYKDVELITADRTVVSADAGKMWIVEQTTNVLTITLPPIASFPEKVPLFFDVIGSNSNAINVVVQGQTGESILQNGFTDILFIFSRAQHGHIIRLGSQWFGVNNSPDAANRGQLHMTNWKSINRIMAIGQEITSAIVPGLKQALSKMEPGTVLTTSSSWNFGVSSSLYWRKNRPGGSSGTVGTRVIYPNKGKFAIYLVAGIETIRIPDWRNMYQRGMRYDFTGVDDQRIGGNIPGGFQQSCFAPHDHYFTHGGRGGVDNNINGGAWGTTSNGNQDELTFQTGGGTITNNDETETRTDNIAQAPMIII